MKNKKILPVLLTIIVILLVAGGLLAAYILISGDVNLERRSKIVIDNYEITVRGDSVTDKYTNSYLTTRFVRKDSDHSSNTYYVSFEKLELIEDYHKGEEGIIYDVRGPDKILNIKDKQFYCYINYSVQNYGLANSATLYYTTPDGLNHLIISVYGGEVYDKAGMQAKHFFIKYIIFPNMRINNSLSISKCIILNIIICN